MGISLKTKTRINALGKNILTEWRCKKMGKINFKQLIQTIKGLNECLESPLEEIQEIPDEELWLFQNEESLQSVVDGLYDSAEGNIVKINLADL